MTAPNGDELTIRVLVVDDHAVVREGIRRILEREPGFQVVGEAVDSASAREQAVALRPDVVVLDIAMPGETGLQATSGLRAAVPECRVLILSMYDDPEYVLESVRAGAAGYLLKDGAAEELRQAVRAVHRGEAWYSPLVALRLSEAVRGELERDRHRGEAGLLTAREREVLVGIAQGQTNKEIGAALGISHRTVETHRESLMRKLRIRTVAGLTRFALETGLITP